jgi:hydrogenase-4 component B
MEKSEVLILYTVLVSGLACLMIPFLAAKIKSLAAFGFILLNSIVTSLLAIKAFLGHAVLISIFGGPVFGDIVISIDPLSAWFILIVNCTCLSGALYGIHYMKPYAAQKANLSIHWSAFVMFHTFMLWVCSLQHSLAFLVAWELMTMASFLLVIFDHSRIANLKAGINYLIQMHIGVSFLIVAFIMVAFKTGDFSFDGIKLYFQNGNSDLLFLFFFLGFGLKAGFVPLHTWLPHAHPAAPSHVSGVMSGVIVKMGIYGILRVLTYLNTNLVLIGASVVAISIITALYGILSGAIHRDIKRILAFCTIENIGIIGMGIGVGLMGKGIENIPLMVIGFSAALLHALNHSLYKSLLFFAAGNIYQQTHSRNMEHLGGLLKKMPWTAFFFLCGALAISGLPPFNGFVSKFLLLTGAIEGILVDNIKFDLVMITCIISLLLAGGLSLLAFSKSFAIVFLGSPRTLQTDHAHEMPFSARIPFAVILLLMLLIGLFPALVLQPIAQIMPLMNDGIQIPYNLAYLTRALPVVGVTSLILISIIAFVYIIRNVFIKRSITVNYSATWGCGYVAPNTRMQYTGKSFSKTLAKLFSFITQEQKKYIEIENTLVFPGKRSYRSSYLEFFEKQILAKVTNSLLAFLSYFSFVHNGKVQMYMLYGVFFILILFMATIFNLL